MGASEQYYAMTSCEKNIKDNVVIVISSGIGCNILSFEFLKACIIRRAPSGAGSSDLVSGTSKLSQFPSG